MTKTGNHSRDEQNPQNLAPEPQCTGGTTRREFLGTTIQASGAFLIG